MSRRGPARGRPRGRGSSATTVAAPLTRSWLPCWMALPRGRCTACPLAALVSRVVGALIEGRSLVLEGRARLGPDQGVFGPGIAVALRPGDEAAAISDKEHLLAVAHAFARHLALATAQAAEAPSAVTSAVTSPVAILPSSKVFDPIIPLLLGVRLSARMIDATPVDARRCIFPAWSHGRRIGVLARHTSPNRVRVVRTSRSRACWVWVRVLAAQDEALSITQRHSLCVRLWIRRNPAGDAARVVVCTDKPHALRCGVGGAALSGNHRASNVDQIRVARHHGAFEQISGVTGQDLHPAQRCRSW